MSPLSVSDSLSNTNEQIEQAVKAIGRSKSSLAVYVAIYHGKRPVKSVSDLVKSTRLTRKQILTSGKRLVDRQIVEQTKHNGETAYRKIQFFYTHRSKVLALVGNDEKLAQLPTKRRAPQSVVVRLPTKGADVEQITIDDIDSFERVRTVPDNGMLSEDISESRFKRGLQAILKEPGDFKDWGGEKNDIYSSRLRIKGKRFQAALALKGPAQKGKLVPGKMGKNGDQLQRLFATRADIFLVQYGGVIGESVIEQMQALAVAKSLADRKKIRFGVVDGSDSNRIYRAYRRKF